MPRPGKKTMLLACCMLNLAVAGIATCATWGSYREWLRCQLPVDETACMEPQLEPDREGRLHSADSGAAASGDGLGGQPHGSSVVRAVRASGELRLPEAPCGPGCSDSSAPSERPVLARASAPDVVELRARRGKRPKAPRRRRTATNHGRSPLRRALVALRSAAAEAVVPGPLQALACILALGLPRSALDVTHPGGPWPGVGRAGLSLALQSVSLVFPGGERILHGVAVLAATIIGGFRTAAPTDVSPAGVRR